MERKMNISLEAAFFFVVLGRFIGVEDLDSGIYPEWY